MSFVYRPQRGLTRSPQTGTGLLVSEWRATVTPVVQKAAGGAKLERFAIDGDRAYFISGSPHGVAWVDADGKIDFDEQRLAGNTLLVERADGLLLGASRATWAAPPPRGSPARCVRSGFPRNPDPEDVGLSKSRQACSTGR